MYVIADRPKSQSKNDIITSEIRMNFKWARAAPKEYTILIGYFIFDLIKNS